MSLPVAGRQVVTSAERLRGRATLRGHVAIMRIDHWFKNLMLAPGLVLALLVPQPLHPLRWVGDTLLALLALGLVASSYYVMNELLDADFDKHHPSPSKSRRPVPSGLVNVRLAYVQCALLFLAGVGLGTLINRHFTGVLVALFAMALAYNAPPIRTKDIAYVDVLTESINNPLRMLAGWFIVNPPGLIPVSALLSYWFLGAHFMGTKRFAEYREIGDPEVAANYRKSFRHYTEASLLVSIVFYAASSMLFLGAFVTRYRMELVLSFPLIALLMAQYLQMSFKPDSAAQRPEALYRERVFMRSLTICVVVMALLMVVDIPLLRHFFEPTGGLLQH